MTKKPEIPNDLPKLSAPAHRALVSAGITSLAEVAQHSEAEIAKLHGVGPTIIVALREAMAAKGLAFKAGKA